MFCFVLFYKAQAIRIGTWDQIGIQGTGYSDSSLGLNRSVNVE